MSRRKTRFSRMILVDTDELNKDMSRRKTRFSRMILVDTDELNKDKSIRQGFDLPDFQPTNTQSFRESDPIFIKETEEEDDYLNSKMEEDEIEARLKKLREGTPDSDEGSKEIYCSRNCSCRKDENKAKSSDVSIQTNLEQNFETEQRPTLKVQRQDNVITPNEENTLQIKNNKNNNTNDEYESLNILMEDPSPVLDNPPSFIKDTTIPSHEEHMETTSLQAFPSYNFYNKQQDQGFIKKQQRKRQSPYKSYMSRYTCSICQSKFDTLSALNIHLQVCKQVMFTCQMCNANFNKEKNLRKHMDTWHSDLNKGNTNKRKMLDIKKNNKFLKI